MRPEYITYYIFHNHDRGALVTDIFDVAIVDKFTPTPN